MTPEEAIEALRLEGGLEISGKAMRFREFMKGLCEAQKALEKQIPKKPKEVDYENSYFICGSCGTAILASDDFESHKYCLSCGQALEWEDNVNYILVEEDYECDV